MPKKKKKSIFVEHIYPILGLILGFFALLITFFQWNEIKGIMPGISNQIELQRLQELELSMNVESILKDIGGVILEKDKYGDFENYVIKKKGYFLQLISDKKGDLFAYCITKRDSKFEIQLSSAEAKENGDFLLGESNFSDFDIFGEDAIGTLGVSKYDQFWGKSYQYGYEWGGLGYHNGSFFSIGVNSYGVMGGEEKPNTFCEMKDFIFYNADPDKKTHQGEYNEGFLFHGPSFTKDYQ